MTSLLFHGLPRRLISNYDNDDDDNYDNDDDDDDDDDGDKADNENDQYCHRKLFLTHQWKITCHLNRFRRY